MDLNKPIKVWIIKYCFDLGIFELTTNLETFAGNDNCRKGYIDNKPHFFFEQDYAFTKEEALQKVEKRKELVLAEALKTIEFLGKYEPFFSEKSEILGEGIFFEIEPDLEKIEAKKVRIEFAKFITQNQKK